MAWVVCSLANSIPSGFLLFVVQDFCCDFSLFNTASHSYTHWRNTSQNWKLCHNLFPFISFEPKWTQYYSFVIKIISCNLCFGGNVAIKYIRTLLQIFLYSLPLFLPHRRQTLHSVKFTPPYVDIFTEYPSETHLSACVGSRGSPFIKCYVGWHSLQYKNGRKM